MAWIESNQELGRHPKTKKFARLLSVTLPEAVGYLHFLWWWALDFAQSGDLSRFDDADIADAVLWEKDPAQLVEALKQAGFLDDSEAGLSIHDWDDYAGRLLDKRRSDAERKRSSRGKSRISEHDPSDVRCASGGRPADGAGNSNRTVPNRNHTVPSTGDTPRTPLDDDVMTKPTLQDERFDRFWASYPKKVGKAAARKSWGKVKPSADLFEKILSAIAAAKKSEQWQKNNGQFVPNPATWLNQGRWDDELPPNRGAPGSSGAQTPMDDLRALHEIFSREDGG